MACTFEIKKNTMDGIKKWFMGLGKLSSEITSTDISHLRNRVTEEKQGEYQKISNFYMKVPWVSCKTWRLVQDSSIFNKG